jgi:hypothetical protein
MDLVLKGSEFHFNADKTSILTYSNTGPSTYTWEFSPDEKSLLLTGSTSTISYELVALDASNLHFRTTSAGITVYKFIKK